VTLSVVVPAYNEAENIPLVYEGVREALSGLGADFELIFVDDGSTDDTPATVEALHERDPRVKLVSLSRNFGHQAALSAGIDIATGDALIMMDGDMQHPPSLIPELVAQWQAGYDIVNARRVDTQDASAFKRASSRFFYFLLNRLSDVPIRSQAADFRLMNRRSYLALRALPERDRFLRGLVSWIGFRQGEVPFVAAGRHAGKTKYSFLKMCKFALSGITGFSVVPLRIAIWLGLAGSILAMFGGVYAIWSKFVTGHVVWGWTSVILAVLGIGSVQLMTIGILGEYLAKTFAEAKGRPLYVVRDTLGLEAPALTQAPTVYELETGQSRVLTSAVGH